MLDNPKKILIVDDNSDLNEMFQIAFEGEGFIVEACSEGLSALSKVIEFKPDVVLLDIMMPQMNGYEFLEAIRHNTSVNTLIVVNSNLEQDKYLIKAKKLKAVEYLKKSEYTPSETVEKVKSFLNLSENERQKILDSQKERRILIVDDEPAVSNMLFLAFENQGFVVDTCADGLSAVTKVVTFKPDVLLLDIKMPNMNGYEVLDAMRKNTSLRIFTVLYSDLIQTDDLELCRKAGMTITFLRKSEYTPKMVADKVVEWLQVAKNI